MSLDSFIETLGPDPLEEEYLRYLHRHWDLGMDRFIRLQHISRLGWREKGLDIWRQYILLNAYVETFRGSRVESPKLKLRRYSEALKKYHSYPK